MDQGRLHLTSTEFFNHLWQVVEKIAMGRVHLLLFVSNTLAVVVEGLPSTRSIDTQSGILLNHDFDEEMNTCIVVPMKNFEIWIHCVILQHATMECAKSLACGKDPCPDHTVDLMYVVHWHMARAWGNERERCCLLSKSQPTPLSTTTHDNGA